MILKFREGFNSGNSVYHHDHQTSWTSEWTYSRLAKGLAGGSRNSGDESNGANHAHANTWRIFTWNIQVIWRCVDCTDIKVPYCIGALSPYNWPMMNVPQYSSCVVPAVGQQCHASPCISGGYTGSCLIAANIQYEWMVLPYCG